MRNYACTPLIPAVLESAEILGVHNLLAQNTWVSLVDVWEETGSFNLQKHLNFWWFRPQKPVLKNWHLSGAVGTHTSLRCWSRTLILRASALREVIFSRREHSSLIRLAWEIWEAVLWTGGSVKCLSVSQVCSLSKFPTPWHTHWRARSKLESYNCDIIIKRYLKGPFPSA